MLRHATRAAAFARNVTGKRVAPAQAGALRFLNLHEYQSRDLMEQYGVQVQKGQMADSADAAYEIAARMKKESAYPRGCCEEGRLGPRRRGVKPASKCSRTRRRRGAQGFRAAARAAQVPYPCPGAPPLRARASGSGAIAHVVPSLSGSA